MPRTLGSNFTIQKNKVSGAEPFLTAIIRFGASRGGDLALIGRSIAALGGATPVIGGTTHHAVVKNWGTLGSGFGSQQDGAPDLAEVTITCNNFPVITGYRLSDRFVAEIETIPVDIYWNFLSGSSVYQEDGPSGSVHAPTTFGFREVSLRITSLMDTYLQGKVLHTINILHFPNAPQDAHGKCFPLAIGNTAESSDVDGARIPAVVVDAHQPSAPVVSPLVNPFALVACEAPTSGLVTASPNTRYWDGHKMVELDFIIETSGSSETLPLYGTLPIAGSDPGRSEAFGYFDDTIVDPLDPSVARVGFTPFNPTPPIGDKGYQMVIQPIRYDYPVRLTNVRIAAVRTDAYSLVASPTTTGKYSGPGIPNPLAPLALKIVDQDTMQQTGPSGDVVHFNEVDKINARRFSEAFVPDAIYNSLTPQGAGEITGDPKFTFHGATHFPVHGFEPQVGKEYSLIFYAGALAGVPDDPGNQFYSLQRSNSHYDATGIGAFGDPSWMGTAYAAGGERVYSPSFPGFTDQSKITQFGNYLVLKVDSISGSTDGVTGDPGDSTDIGTTGIFQLSLEPEDTRVIGGITLWARKQVSSGSAIAVDLKGSLTVGVDEVDRHGAQISTLGSASFAAEEFSAFIDTSGWQEIFQFFSSPLLLEVNKKYVLTIQGELDVNGTFSGWAIQGLTNPTFTAGYGQPMGRKSYGSVMTRGLSQVPIRTSTSEPASIRIILHAVKFDTAIEFWDDVRTWTLHPYVRVQDKRFVIPSGTDISTDVNCTLTRPDQVIHALLNRAGVDDSRIDLSGTFADSAAHYSTIWKLRGAVCDQITYKALIPRLAFESRSDFDWEFHQAQLKWLPQPGDVVLSARTITLADVPPVSQQDPLPDFYVTRTETDSIINVVNVAFQRMFNVGKGRSAYLLGDQFVNFPSLAVHQRKDNDGLFEFDFIRDVGLAQNLGIFYVLWLAYALPKPVFTTKLQTLELMKGDVITLDLSPLTGSIPPGDILGGGGVLGGGGFLGDAAGAFNGWTDQPVLIRAIQYDWNTQRIQYTVVVA